jgi:hypothetical protein
MVEMIPTEVSATAGPQRCGTAAVMGDPSAPDVFSFSCPYDILIFCFHSLYISIAFRTA